MGGGSSRRKKGAPRGKLFRGGKREATPIVKNTKEQQSGGRRRRERCKTEEKATPHNQAEGRRTWALGGKEGGGKKVRDLPIQYLSEAVPEKKKRRGNGKRVKERKDFWGNLYKPWVTGEQRCIVLACFNFGPKRVGSIQKKGFTLRLQGERVWGCPSLSRRKGRYQRGRRVEVLWGRSGPEQSTALPQTKGKFTKIKWHTSVSDLPGGGEKKFGSSV